MVPGLESDYLQHWFHALCICSVQICIDGKLMPLKKDNPNTEFQVLTFD